MKKMTTVLKDKITAVSLALLLAAPLAGSAQQEQPMQSDPTFTLVGTAPGISDSAKIFLIYPDYQAMKNKYDTIAVKNGRFTYSAPLHSDVPLKIIAMLARNGEFPRKHPDGNFFYVEAGETRIDITDSLKHAVFAGRAVDEAKRYADYIHVSGGNDPGLGYPVNGVSLMIFKTHYIPGLKGDSSKSAPLPGGKSVNDDDKIKDSIRVAQRAALIDQRRALQKEYIAANPDSYFSLMAVQELALQDNIMNVAEVEPLFNSLSPRLRNCYEGKKFGAKMEDAKTHPGVDREMEMALARQKQNEDLHKPAFSIGDMAPDFTMNDADGKPVHLSDFKGKYVLVDFWASWCVPCRAENPNVVKAYNEFKDRNFTVLGIALEQPGPSDKWLNAIKKDGLPFTEVSDFSYFNSPVAKMYKVHAIPQNFLVDPSGKVIGFGLKAEALQKKLAEVLNN